MKLVKAYQNGVEYLFDEYKAPYTYSYTFKGKTATEVRNEFTTLVGTINIDSNGFTGSSSTDARAKKDIPTIGNAKKITVTGTIVGQNDAITATRIGIGKGTGWGSGETIFALYGSTYGGTKVIISYNGTAYEGNSVGNAAGATYKPTLIIDLEAKTLTGKLSGFSDSTYSLTDAIVADIRTYDQLIPYVSLNKSSISDIAITIEY